MCKMFYFMPFLPIIMPILLIILLCLLFWSAGKRCASLKHLQPPQETPLDILKKRYAKGEISKEQFQEMKKDISVN